MLKFTAAGSTHQNQRPEQADRLLVFPFTGGLLCAVLDGVGSHKHGDVAADCVVRHLTQRVESRPTDFRDAALETLDQTLRSAREDLAGLSGSTTLTALVLHEEGLASVAHIGDCALYRYRPHVGLDAVTTAQRYGRHILSHALHGREETSYTSSSRWSARALEQAAPGDVYLLASDGCYEYVSETMISVALATVSVGQVSPAELAAALVRQSMSNASLDNTTAIVAYVEAQQDTQR